MATEAARREQKLAEMAQRARLEAESREHQAMAKIPLDFEGLIRAHLAKHPDETSYALELLHRYREVKMLNGTSMTSDRWTWCGT